MAMAYGINVLDGQVSPRRLAALIDRLPPWARNGGAAWSTESYLLAEIIDRLDSLTYVTLKAHGAKSVRKPPGFPRPPDVPRITGRPPEAAPGPRKGTSGEGGPGGWWAAAEKLAKIPGVKVEGSG
jgi:hypothetical protein